MSFCKHPYRTNFALGSLVLLLAAMLFIPAGAADAAEQPTADIVNGTVVADDPAEWPFIVALLANSNPQNAYCGGSLVKPTWVVTAAHCVDTATTGLTPPFILIGRKNLAGTGGELIPVNQVRIHPQWDANELENDVALLQLDHAPAYTPSTIEMATAAEDPVATSTVSVAGWGATDPDGTVYPNDLYEANINVDSNASCEAAWGIGWIFASNLCASFPDGVNTRDTCFGDSGGPLVNQTPGGLRLSGITSWGSDPCADPALPGVYTRVSSVRSWVLSQAGRDLTAAQSSVNFGSALVDGDVTYRRLAIHSTGAAPVNVYGIGSSLPSEFRVIRDGCTGAWLPSGTICTADIEFAPAGLGARFSTLVVYSNSEVQTATPVALSGFAPARAPAAVHFGIRLAKRPTFLTRTNQIRTVFVASYRLPPDTTRAQACVGKIRLSIRLPRASRAYIRYARLGSSSGGCAATFVVRLPRRAYRRVSFFRASFLGNAAVAAGDNAERIRIK